MNRVPVAGDVIGVGPAASVQFGGGRKLMLRVVAVDSRPTYHGFAWVAGYVVDRAGVATDKREVFVQVAGLVLVQAARRPARPSSGQGTNNPRAVLGAGGCRIESTIQQTQQ